MADVYDLKLHEAMRVNDDTVVLRVPGGWIYTIRFRVFGQKEQRASSVFVPLNSEFDPQFRGRKK